MAPVVKLVGGSTPCIHRVNEVKYWKSPAVFFQSKRV